MLSTFNTKWEETLQLVHWCQLFGCAGAVEGTPNWESRMAEVACEHAIVNEKCSTAWWDREWLVCEWGWWAELKIWNGLWGKGATSICVPFSSRSGEFSMDLCRWGATIWVWSPPIKNEKMKSTPANSGINTVTTVAMSMLYCNPWLTLSRLSTIHYHHIGRYFVWGAHYFTLERHEHFGHSQKKMEISEVCRR